jgi:hypothetical protein
VKPGSDIRHIDWAAQAIVEYRPDVVVVMGDWWDFPSLNNHNEKGSLELENKRYQDDVDAGNEAFRRLCKPMNERIERISNSKHRKWEPRKVFLVGNHEDRADRVWRNDPKWKGVIGSQNCQTLDFEVYPFLKIVKLEGIAFSHYFPNPFSGRPIGGTIANRLSHIGSSFVQGHQQGFLYGSKTYPDHVKHGIVCGRYYLEDESYRPPDVQATEWNGLLVLNQVKDGDYDLMAMRYAYLAKKYG